MVVVSAPVDAPANLAGEPAGASSTSVAFTTTLTVAVSLNCCTYALTAIGPAKGARTDSTPVLETVARSSLSQPHAAVTVPS